MLQTFKLYLNENISNCVIVLCLENARRQWCAVLSNISNNGCASQWFTRETQRCCVYNGFQFVWIPIDTCSTRSRSKRIAGGIPNYCSTVSRSSMLVYCGRNWGGFWWMECTKLNTLFFLLSFCIYNYIRSISELLFDIRGNSLRSILV